MDINIGSLPITLPLSLAPVAEDFDIELSSEGTGSPDLQNATQCINNTQYFRTEGNTCNCTYYKC